METKICCGEDCLIIGARSYTVGAKNHVVIIGDDCVATENDQVVVGSHLLGEEIPEAVQKCIVENVVQFKWLLDKVIRHIHLSQLK